MYKQWKCICGTWNNADREVCRVCGRERTREYHQHESEVPTPPEVRPFGHIYTT